MKLIHAGGDGALAGEFDIRGPALLLGIGHVGGKIASSVAQSCGCKHLEIAYEDNHLSDIDSTVHIARHGWVNPSAPKLRALASGQISEIEPVLKRFRTVFVIANLAGRGGVGIGPLVCRKAKDLGCAVISIAIMPFGFENDRIFAAGVALSRIRETSDSLVIVDNNAYLQNNPQDSPERCYAAVNQAIHDIITLILHGGRTIGRLNIVTTDPTIDDDLESSLESSLAALYPQISKQGCIGKSVIHLASEGNSRLSLDRLSMIVTKARSALSDSTTASVSLTTAQTSGESRVHLITSVLNGTVFEDYDPLARVIPKEKFIDWEELDSSPELSLPVFGIE